VSHRPRILVVDDNDSLRENLVELLESEGYQVAEARNGHEALVQLAQAPLPALVLVDMMMPGISGRELVSLIRAEPRLASVRIVLATGMVPVRGAVEADAVLSKPFGVEELLAALRPLLAEREAVAGQRTTERA
jgi:CheY-like chemotaxis protein